jgi:chromosome segregation ATPase
VEAYLDEMSVSHDKLASSAALAERRLTDATARLEEAEFRLNETNARVAGLESQIEAGADSVPASSGDSDENMKAMLAGLRNAIIGAPGKRGGGSA